MLKAPKPDPSEYSRDDIVLPEQPDFGDEPMVTGGSSASGQNMDIEVMTQSRKRIWTKAPQPTPALTDGMPSTQPESEEEQAAKKSQPVVMLAYSLTSEDIDKFSRDPEKFFKKPMARTNIEV